MNNDYKVIYINEVELPVPSSQPTEHLKDLHAESITSWKDGSTKPNPIRMNMYSIDLMWDPIPYATFQSILEMITPNHQGYLNAKIYDELSQSYIERKMICSDRSFVKKMYKDGCYVSLSVTLTEI